MKNIFDQLSPEDMAAFGRGLGEALGPYIKDAIETSTAKIAADILAKLDSLDPKITFDISKKG